MESIIWLGIAGLAAEAIDMRPFHTATLRAYGVFGWLKPPRDDQVHANIRGTTPQINLHSLDPSEASWKSAIEAFTTNPGVFSSDTEQAATPRRDQGQGKGKGRHGETTPPINLSATGANAPLPLPQPVFCETATHPPRSSDVQNCQGGPTSNRNLEDSGVLGEGKGGDNEDNDDHAPESVVQGNLLEDDLGKDQDLGLTGLNLEARPSLPQLGRLLLFLLFLLNT
jgi:hypothetical protein